MRTMSLHLVDSTHSQDPVQVSLGRLLSRWVDEVRDHSGHLPRLLHDDDWPSPCIVEGPDAHGQVNWRPVARGERADFSGIERALEIRLHADVQSF